MKITNELKIGIFVIFVLTASFFVINFLRGKDIFGKEITKMWKDCFLPLRYI